MLEIAIPDGPAWSQRVRLDGVYYTISVRWNDRAQVWMLDAGDSDGVVRVAGIAIRLGVHLLGQAQDPRLPPGALFATDSAPGALDPGRYDLGDRVRLLYLDAAELAGLRA